MSTSNSKNLVGSAPSTTDRRSIAGKRRIQAQQKMSDVAVQLIKQAVSLGVKAQYVLFDSWYSSPKMFWNLRQLNLDGIGMLKKSQKTYFKYRGRQYSVKALYERIKHSRVKIKDDYLFSCMVQAQYEGYQFELKLVFVSKKGRDDDYLILATTQTKLQPQTIIQLYGRRWQIESYFRASKQFLAMDESQIQSYDGQVSYIAITELAYILLAWQERLNTDDKTLGDLVQCQESGQFKLRLQTMLRPVRNDSHSKAVQKPLGSYNHSDYESGLYCSKHQYIRSKDDVLHECL